MRRARQIPRGHVGMLVPAESSSVTELKEPTRDRDSSSLLQSAESDNDRQEQRKHILCKNGFPQERMAVAAAPCSQDSDVVDSQRINKHKHANTLGTTALFEGGNNKKASGINKALHVLRRYPKRRRNNNNNVQTETAEEPPISKKGNSNSNSIFSEKARACTECGKEFSSWKALFGHMRCHPEREWRGINPPQDVRQQRQHMMMTSIITEDGEPQAAAGQSSSSLPPAPPHPPRSHLRNHLKFHKRQTVGKEMRGIPGLVNLFGIESSGLTASMAIAEMVSLIVSQSSR